MNTDKTNAAKPGSDRISSPNLSSDEAQKATINDGVRRMEDIIKGQTTGLTEIQFRAALG